MGAKAIWIRHSDFFFLSMPVSLSRIIRHSHLFTRLEIYHHIYFINWNCIPRGVVCPGRGGEGYSHIYAIKVHMCHVKDMFFEQP